MKRWKGNDPKEWRGFWVGDKEMGLKVEISVSEFRLPKFSKTVTKASDKT